MSLSGDGSILAVGGSADNNGVGATWVFQYNDGSGGYTQLGSKLVGTGYEGNPLQGSKEGRYMVCLVAKTSHA